MTTQQCLSTCAPTIQTFMPLTVPTGGLAVASLSSGCVPSCALNAGTGFTGVWFIGGGGTQFGASEYSTTGFTNPTLFPFTQSTGTAYFDLVGAVFPTATGGSITTVINTMEQNPSGGNGTYNYIARGTLYYYPSQNVATTSTMNNVTLKIGPIYINSTIGTFYLLTYTANGPPSPSNPWTLINTVSLPVYNNTSLAYFVHRNPQSSICPSCYYMEAIMAATGHSNSASVTGSGVKVEEIARPSETENYYTIHSITPPVNFYSSSLKSEHFDWIYTNLIFTVATITTTVSSTLTTGAATVTTTINQAGIQTNVDLYLALAIIGGLFLIMAKVGGIAGAMFGAIVGEIICIVGGIITGDLADVALVATMLGCAAMIYMGRSPGGGGGV